jgi:HAD superfamily hydrolase (TIGR01509 family)
VTWVEAVVFDLDGVIVDSEHLWDEVREKLARERGGRWHERAQADMMGMSAPEWSRYVRERVGVDLEPEAIDAEVVRRLLAHYREGLPLIPGAVAAVRRLGARWPIGLASSSNREVIDAVLEATSLVEVIRVSVSSEEVARGKPAPDVYLEAVRRLGVAPARAAAVEDSSNGLRSARAAGLRLVAVPHPRFPPDPDALALADVVLDGIGRLDVATVEALAAPSGA